MKPGDRIRAVLAERRDAQRAFLVELVRVPSDNPPGDCAPHGLRAAELLEGLGFDVERHPVPDHEVRAQGLVSITNLVVRRRFGDGPVIALNAHGDAVPPGAGWSHDPRAAEVADGVMYGRGVAVSKSDFATYAFALAALEAVAPALGGTVELHFTHDEESGGALGPEWLLKNGIVKPDYAVSAGFAHAVVTAHNGCLHLEVEVIGRQAHAAMPEIGVDALEGASRVLGALYAHRRDLANVRSNVPGLAHPTLVVGTIEGGVNTNVVPGRVVLRLDRRLIPEDDGVRVEDELVKVMRAAAAEVPGCEVAITRLLRAEPLLPLAGVAPLRDAFVRAASEVLGVDVPAKGVALYTDARHYAAAGIPTILYGAGPASIDEANAHAADERLDLDDLYKATEAVALALLDLLETEA